MSYYRHNGSEIGRSYVYFVRSGEFVKIGTTGLGVNTRLSTLQVGAPNDLELIGIIEGPDGLEKRIHRMFQSIHHNREWFKETRELRAFILSHTLPLSAEDDICKGCRHSRRSRPYPPGVGPRGVRPRFNTCPDHRWKDI